MKNLLRCAPVGVTLAFALTSLLALAACGEAKPAEEPESVSTQNPQPAVVVSPATVSSSTTTTVTTSPAPGTPAPGTTVQSTTTTTTAH